jgi:hypothetical protein
MRGNGLVDKINLPFYYELGAVLKPLVNLTPPKYGEDAEPKFRYWMTARSAASHVENLLGPGMRVSSATGSALLATIKAIDDWSLEKMSEPWTWEERSAISTLIRQATAFEAVILAEMQQLPSYIVTQQGAYESERLINSTYEVFPLSVRPKLTAHVVKDISESGRCLAYGVPTASGMHILRAVESVVRDYYLKVCAPSQKPARGQTLGWYITRLRAHTDAHGKEVAELLNQIREKHRNGLMHPDEFLDADEAFTLFEIAKTAIIAMAPRLDGNPPLS